FEGQGWFVACGWVLGSVSIEVLCGWQFTLFSEHFPFLKWQLTSPFWLHHDITICFLVKIAQLVTVFIMSYRR
ncbi:hypothetical protein, partial [Klebsiella pneumoniae]|uniref:hypothetical protein n=1 Tax=Klebsiella pneumoniae TaxID=573 RepID=UPI001D0EDEE1